MEAYFYGDTRIQEQLDLIVERLFTACLLTGKEADSEFAKGRTAVQKVGLALLESSVLTPELLGEGLVQLVEQRLPDPRVIENFPAFRTMMGKMLQEGIGSLEIHPPENMETAYLQRLHAPSPVSVRNTSKVVLAGGRTPVLIQEPGAGPIPVRARVLDNSHLEEGIAALAGILQTERGLKDILDDGDYRGPLGNMIENSENSIVMGSKAMVEFSQGIAEEVKVISTEDREKAGIEFALLPKGIGVDGVQGLTKAEVQVSQVRSHGGVARTRASQIPPEGARLALVLKQMFPDSQVRWDFPLAGYRFMAQVEDLLIFINEPLDNHPIYKLERQGWRLVVCSGEDLAYPRRVERLIRLALRKVKRAPV
ncbi:MAG: hypothetical protein ACYCVD_05735 [Desulfitobacteriaceae bacterium]